MVLVKGHLVSVKSAMTSSNKGETGVCVCLLISSDVYRSPLIRSSVLLTWKIAVLLISANEVTAIFSACNVYSLKINLNVCNDVCVHDQVALNISFTSQGKCSISKY